MNLNKEIRLMHVIDSNLEHIAKTGNINGTLHVEIQKLTHKVAKEAFEIGRNFQLTGENNFNEWWESLNQQEEYK